MFNSGLKVSIRVVRYFVGTKYYLEGFAVIRATRKQFIVALKVVFVVYSKYILCSKVSLNVRLPVM